MSKQKLKETQISAKPTKSQNGRQYAICIPSSIISSGNARNLEQITNIAYLVARAATIYNVLEIIILDTPSAAERAAKKESDSHKVVAVGGETGNKKISFNLSHGDIDPLQQLGQTKSNLEGRSDNDNNGILFATLLQYFVTPPYLVKGVFQESKFKHKFKYAEKLPKLSTLPFMKYNDVLSEFKEGLSIPKHTPRIKKRNKKVSAVKKLQVTKYINIGQSTPLILSGTEIPINVRVTVDVKNRKIISPQIAYGVSGTKSSFGYFVRYASTFSSVFTELSFPNGYSESILIEANDYFSKPRESELKTIEHATEGQVLLVVGKIEEFQYKFSQEDLPGVDSVTDMFDGKIEVPHGIRIEDAVIIGLTRAL